MSNNEHRSGRVALIGWTNVGKSTLLNQLVGVKIAAVADVSQTTRHQILGVTPVDDRAQIAYVDTPGWHRPQHRMNRRMMERTRESLRDVDAIIWVIDGSKSVGPGDKEVLRALKEIDIPCIAAINKIDKVSKKASLLPQIEALAKERDFHAIIPISAASGDGCDALTEAVIELLPVGPPMFDDDFLTDQSQRQIVSELVREQLVRQTREELPHSTAVVIDLWEEEGDLVRIEASVVVERDSQKKIVIGRQGGLLKSVGTAARLEIEKLLERKVYLRLWARAHRDWRNDRAALRELGLH